MTESKTKSKDRFKIIIASAFGLGLSPIMPGTFGALLGVIFHLLIIAIFPVKMQIFALLSVFLAVCITNHILTPWAENFWQAKDPQHFVLDEVAGYLFVPILFHHGKSWEIILWGFIFFRVYDIIKLPGARYVDKNIPGAWGILIDDLISALYAVFSMYLLKIAGFSFV